ncbi:unnamed protein product [Prorocentrum cordatum]|uniref:Uncharacterized protein n=1 Tax=Prorocentrum cordatum TaxID=2364126 RepID=A0ABN9SB94_9DINO|nr:unnamed protein product [Polarella glacialis]
MAMILALEITSLSCEYMYNGDVWAHVAEYTDLSRNKLVAPFFDTNAIGIRVEMNGQSHDFLFENSDLCKSLHTLVTGITVKRSPCSSTSVRKPFAYATVQTLIPHSNLWGMVPSGSQ